MKQNLNSRSHLRGLTLLEVLLSLGILIIVLICFVSYTQKAKQSNTTNVAKIQINTLLNAAVQYYTTYAQWPSSLNALMPILTGNAAINPAFCSPWFGSTGCAAYTIAANTTYFALKVTTPGMRYAENLVRVLPNAYIDTDTRTVIAYVNTAKQQGYHVTPPLGVLYASDANYWSGSLTFSNNSYCNVSSNGPYGLIDVTRANFPGYSVTTTSCQTTNNQTFRYKTPTTCPDGSTAAMLLLPMGTPPSSAFGTSTVFFYLYNYYLNYSSSEGGPSAVASVVYPSTGTSRAPDPLILSAPDLLCLDPTTISWAPNATPQCEVGTTGSICPP